MPYEITQCYLPPGRGDFPPLPQPKLVLDLATPEGCKAEVSLFPVSFPPLVYHVSELTVFDRC